ncbi:MAG: hypothetical protein AABY47_01055 [Pseudomonadota bacterium]
MHRGFCGDVSRETFWRYLKKILFWRVIIGVTKQGMQIYVYCISA